MKAYKTPYAGHLISKPSRTLSKTMWEMIAFRYQVTYSFANRLALVQGRSGMSEMMKRAVNKSEFLSYSSEMLKTASH